MSMRIKPAMLGIALLLACVRPAWAQSKPHLAATPKTSVDAEIEKNCKLRRGCLWNRKYADLQAHQTSSKPYANVAGPVAGDQSLDDGKLGGSPYDPNSTSNPYGPNGSPYAADSTNNPYGAGSPYRIDSPNNPYGAGSPYRSDSPNNTPGDD